jgi:hypothetical protein
MSNTQTQAVSAIDALAVNATGASIAASGDHEYFAQTQEVISLGRDPVTSLVTEPPHTFDIVWNMDLNTALNTTTVIRPPIQVDASEETTKKGVNNAKYYNLATGTFSKEISAVLTGTTSLTYTNVFPIETLPYTIVTMSTDGTTLVCLVSDTLFQVYKNNVTTGLFTPMGSPITNTFALRSACMNYNGTVFFHYDADSNIRSSIYNGTDWVTNGTLPLAASSIKWNVDYSGNVIAITYYSTVIVYERLTGTTWTQKGLPISNSINYGWIKLSSDGLSVMVSANGSNHGQVYTYGGTSTSAWVATASSTGTTVSAMSDDLKTVFASYGPAVYIKTYDSASSTWVLDATKTSSASIMFSMRTLLFVSNDFSTFVLKDTTAAGKMSIVLYKWSGTEYTFLSQIYSIPTTVIAIGMNTLLTLNKTVYNLDSATRIGTGSTEAECMISLSKQLEVTNTRINLLLSDGSNDVGTTMNYAVAAAVSSSVQFSLSDSTQTTAVNNFLAALKTAAGSFRWYDLTNLKNRQTVTTQVRNGLAQLFDRDPQLNNLIGSAATSSTFLDASKIQAKLQSSTNDFYTKFFSVTQLKEVLEAVADKGSRVTVGATFNTWAFVAGDSISCVLRVIDTDSSKTAKSQNSERWLITLQQS